MFDLTKAIKILQDLHRGSTIADTSWLTNERHDLCFIWNETLDGTGNFSEFCLVVSVFTNSEGMVQSFSFGRCFTSLDQAHLYELLEMTICTGQAQAAFNYSRGWICIIVQIWFMKCILCFTLKVYLHGEQRGSFVKHSQFELHCRVSLLVPCTTEVYTLHNTEEQRNIHKWRSEDFP